MPSVAWIFSILGNRLTKSAFAAGVATLSPAGKSRSDATDGAANQRVWSARPKAASGCRWSGSCWILQSGPTRAATAESPDERKGRAGPECHARKSTGPQTGVRIFAHPTCAFWLRPSFCREPQQVCGDSAPAAITSGTEGADLKSLHERKGRLWAHCALAVHEIHFLIGRFAGEMEVGDRYPVPKGLGLARPFETAIKPVPWRARASGRWTMQQEGSDLVSPHVDHSATDQLFAREPISAGRPANTICDNCHSLAGRPTCPVSPGAYSCSFHKAEARAARNWVASASLPRKIP